MNPTEKQLETLLQLNTEKDIESFKVYHTELSNRYGIVPTNLAWIQYQVRTLNIDGKPLNSEYK